MSLASGTLTRAARRRPAAAPGPAPRGSLSSGEERYHALDALRATAMLLGIVLHAAISYMPCRMPHLLWALHEQTTTPWLNWLFWGLHAFRLPLFFLIAGFFSPLLYDKRGGHAYLANRLRRVVWPLLLSSVVLLPIVLLVWCLGWLLSGECTPGHVLRLKFRWDLQEGVYGLGHLWFLEHLFLMCLGFWAWRAGPWRDCGMGWQDRLWQSRYKPLWLALPSALVVFVDPSAVIDFDQPFLPQPGRFVYYTTFFVAGTWLYRQRRRLHEITRFYKAYLLLAAPVLLSLGMLLSLEISATLPLAGRVALALDHALFAWLMALGLLGLFVRVLDRPSPTVRWFSDASYYVYLVHMPVVALVNIALYPLGWWPTLKFMVSMVVPTLLCLATWHDLVRGSRLEELLNGRRAPLSPVARPRAWCYVSIPMIMILLIVAGLWHMRQFCFDNNLHAVIPGVAYRSAKLSAGDLGEQISRLQLRTVVNLGGGDDGLPWFAAQKQTCFAQGVALYVLDLPEDTLPSREQLEALIAVADHAPRPILFQGRFGLGRAALAGAVSVLLSGDLPQAAHQQYLLKHGCCDRTPGSTQNVVRAYEAWLLSTSRHHTPAEFRGWVSGQYEPAHVRLAASQAFGQQ